MKHKKTILSISFLAGLLFLALSSSAAAWKNGPADYSSGLRPDGKFKMCASWAQDMPPYEEAVACYQRFFVAHDSAWYSTHDYIAHFALDYLCASDPSGKYNWVRDPNQRYLYIYLLATEYPDYALKTAPQLSLDEGRKIITFSDIPRAHSYTDLECLRATRKAARSAVKSFNEYRLREAAVFYLGLIAHIIGDLSFPPHVLRPYSVTFDGSTSTDVSQVTTLEDYQINGNGFFSINLESILGYTPVALNVLELFNFLPEENHEDIVYFIAEMMALTTLLNLEVFFNLNVGNGTWSTQNLYNFFREKGNFRFKNIERDEPEYKPYLDRIQELLNWAVYWTAAALKICLDAWDGEDSNDESQQPDKTNRDRDFPFDAVDFLVRYGPMIAAVTAVGVLGRDLLGKFSGRF